MSNTQAKLSISKASKIFGKDRKTISSYIAKGKLSCETNEQGHKLIDFSELRRVYGEPKNKPNAVSSPSPVGNNEENPQHSPPISAPHLQVQISMLEQQIDDLRKDKEEGLRREQELREIIKNQTLLLEDKRTQQPKSTIPAKVLWVFLPVCVIITATPFIAWLVLNFLKQ